VRWLFVLSCGNLSFRFSRTPSEVLCPVTEKKLEPASCYIHVHETNDTLETALNVGSLILCHDIVVSARWTIVQNTVLRSHVVRLSVRPSVCSSVTFVDQDHTGWKFRKVIARTISPIPSLFVGHRPFTCSQWNMGKFWGD